jgi:hypothetical protein
MIHAAAISPNLREKRLATAQKWLRFLLRIRWAVAAVTFLLAVVGNALILRELNQLPSWLSTIYFYYPDSVHTRCVADDAPAAPSFILIGAQDEGTLELANKLKEHPLVRSGARALTSFCYASVTSADWGHEYTDDEMCRVRRDYAAQFPRLQPRMIQPQTFVDPDSSSSSSVSRIKALDGTSNMITPEWAAGGAPNSLTFEHSADYLTKFNLPQLIRKICPWTKIIINVGHPGDRLWWYFKSSILMFYDLPMAIMNSTTWDEVGYWMDSGFVDNVDTQVKELRRRNLTNAPTLSEYRLWSSGQTITIGNRSFLAPPAISNETMFQTKESWFGIVGNITPAQRRDSS